MKKLRTRFQHDARCRSCRYWTLGLLDAAGVGRVWIQCENEGLLDVVPGKVSGGEVEAVVHHVGNLQELAGQGVGNSEGRGAESVREHGSFNVWRRMAVDDAHGLAKRRRGHVFVVQDDGKLLQTILASLGVLRLHEVVQGRVPRHQKSVGGEGGNPGLSGIGREDVQGVVGKGCDAKVGAYVVEHVVVAGEDGGHIHGRSMLWRQAGGHERVVGRRRAAGARAREDGAIGVGGMGRTGWMNARRRVHHVVSVPGGDGLRTVGRAVGKGRGRRIVGDSRLGLGDGQGVVSLRVGMVMHVVHDVVGRGHRLSHGGSGKG